MPVVNGLVFYLGTFPAAKHAASARNLMIEDNGFLCQRFHRSLLEAREDPARFRAKVDIPELPPMDMRWTPVGQTAGVAFCSRGRCWRASLTTCSGTLIGSGGCNTRSRTSSGC